MAQPLDRLLDSEPKIRILRFLCRKGGEWSGRRMAAELSMNPVTAHRALRQLRAAAILDLRRVGRSDLYSLEDRRDLVEEVLRPFFDSEANVRSRLVHLLRQGLAARREAPIVSAAIYGSVARGQEHPRSDLDLLVLVPSEQAKRQIQPMVDRLGETVREKFGFPLAPYLNTVAEARQKLRRRLPVFVNILESHELILGRPLRGILHDRAA